MKTLLTLLRIAVAVTRRGFGVEFAVRSIV